MLDKAQILVVDDDLIAAELLAEVLAKEGYRVEVTTSGSEAIRIAEKGPLDLVITDIKMPEIGGLQVVSALRKRRPDITLIVITAFGSFQTAVEAIQNGAYDYISKPFKIEEMKVIVRRALEQRRLLRDNQFHLEETGAAAPFENLIGNSPKMLEIYKLVARVANSDVSILIQGESGTGKELVARAIHDHSLRASKPYVAVNCGALAESLLESELFGHTKGAFTGAITQKKGLFEEANEGTCFLDEIGEISPALQTKLLRVLQEREVRPVGSSENIPINIRIVAATNKDLKLLVRSGQFREDLFYRLHVVTVTLPPLREHIEDIPLLADYFLQKHIQRAQKNVQGISKETMKALAAYDWPGNIRQLENVIERAIALTTNKILLPSDIPDDLFQQEALPEIPVSPMTLEEVKWRYIRQVLDESGGNQNKTAEILGIDRKTLYRLLKRYKHRTDIP